MQADVLCYKPAIDCGMAMTWPMEILLASVMEGLTSWIACTVVPNVAAIVASESP